MLRLVFLLAAFVWGGPVLAVRAAPPLFESAAVFSVTPQNRPNYRIPALLQAPNGDLLVFVEKRHNGIGDIGNHDIAFKRSRDRGRTWSAEQILFDDGDRPCADMTVGVDTVTGKIWLFFLRDKKEFTYFTSRDSGATWQGPVSIHDQVTKSDWAAKRPATTEKKTKWGSDTDQRYGIGPGNAVIQLQSGPKKGRLLVPARHNEETGSGRRSFSHTFYSDDHGATWKRGGTVGVGTGECQLVELADGTVLLMARPDTPEDGPDNMRHLTARSSDGGETWGPVRRAEELITPGCMGSVARLTLASTHDKNRLLFSNPASPVRQKEYPYGRYNLTVRLSYDEGETWTAGKTMWPHPSSYSDLVTLDDGTIGFVYERGPKDSTHYWDELHFARFNLEWLTSGQDTVRLPDSAK